MSWKLDGGFSVPTYTVVCTHVLAMTAHTQVIQLLSHISVSLCTCSGLSTYPSILDQAL